MHIFDKINQYVNYCTLFSDHMFTKEMSLLHYTFQTVEIICFTQIY